MTTIQDILFPVDFSSSCVAMAPFVKRAASIFGARVTLIHVFDVYSHDPVQLYMRPLSEVAEEQQNLARDKLDSFLKVEFPLTECPRILLSGDAAIGITQLARKNGFDLIIMPTHAGLFRRTLLGSTTAKVLNHADCPVLTTARGDHFTQAARTSGMGLRHWLGLRFAKGPSIRQPGWRVRPTTRNHCLMTASSANCACFLLPAMAMEGKSFPCEKGPKTIERRPAPRAADTENA
jgi:nucleotide-binding universal stress UspA family protein